MEVQQVDPDLTNTIGYFPVLTLQVNPTRRRVALCGQTGGLKEQYSIFCWEFEGNPKHSVKQP